MAEAMENTGERMIPETSDTNTLWEHIYRYKFATGFVKGQRVLDIACGEGYGTFALQSAGAASVIGVDISEEACRHGREKYAIDTRVGDASKIPLPDGSIDVVVSFETIEHVQEPTVFVRECTRVLAASGTLVISTPNVDTYNPERTTEHNPFHCSELTGTEFLSLLSAHFGTVKLYAQVAIDAPDYSISGLVARNNRWKTFRGYHRFILSRFPTLDDSRQAAARSNPVDEILRREGWLEGKLNPYAVWTHKLGSRIQPLYYIAVASDPKSVSYS